MVEIELLDKTEYTEQQELVNDMMMLIASIVFEQKKTERNEKTMKVMKELKKYSDITDDDCVFYSGKMLKDIYSKHNSLHQLSFETIKNNMRDKRIYNPYSDFDDDKMYKCFEYSRVSGAGIEYNTIAIMNY